MIKDRDELVEFMKEKQSRLIHGAVPVYRHMEMILDSMEAAGVILVPVEATEEMINAGWDTDRENIGEEGNTLMPEPVWNAMRAVSLYRRKE